MVSNFIIENRTTQENITFGQSDEFQYLIKEVDWGNASASHNTYNFPNQVGVSISSTKINSRDISITGYVYYLLTKEEMIFLNRNMWEDYCYEKIKQKKKMLDEIINPIDYVRVIIGNYYIEGKPSSSVKYGINEEENNIYFCKFLINIYCNNPMFKKNTVTKTVISGSSGIFHFPWVLKPSGVAMSSRKNYLILAVENEGSVAIGGKIIFKAKGEVLNPSVENLSTGEKITINKTLQKGEIVTVNTVDGKEKNITGYLNGVTTGYLNYWNFENSWFKFGKGTTLIGYYTENSAESLLDVSIELNPEKYNLEDM